MRQDGYAWNVHRSDSQPDSESLREDDLLVFIVLIGLNLGEGRKHVKNYLIVLIGLRERKHE